MSEIFNDAFRRWFGSSAVADRSGRPLVVYHGTPDARALLAEGFKSWSRKDSFFATDSYTMANSYANDHRAFDYQTAEPLVVPLYLSIKNPLFVDAHGRTWSDTEHHVSAAKLKGHDGIIILNSVDFYETPNRKKIKGATVFVWFRPSQAKSAITGQMLSRVDRRALDGAIANDGTWDADDPRIQSNPRRRR